MDFLIILIVLVFIIFYLVRPTSIEELKRSAKIRDNWSIMGFWQIQLSLARLQSFEVLLIDR